MTVRAALQQQWNSIVLLQCRRALHNNLYYGSCKSKKTQQRDTHICFFFRRALFRLITHYHYACTDVLYSCIHCCVL